eukprot:GILI01014247.1.p2 GENE.GILI01014247.1~~GILI01014247.1.p2  ORF type:complete len:272 (+),score=77.74 GILI01014247.1:68-883(+)
MDYDFEPPIDEEDDTSLPTPPPPVFKWSEEFAERLKEGDKLSARTLFVGLRTAGAAFLQSALESLDTTVAATVTLPEIPTSLQASSLVLSPANLASASSSPSGTLCVSKGSVPENTSLYLVLHSPVSADRAVALTDLLFAHLTVRRVVVLESLLTCFFRSFDPPAVPALRSMRSSIMMSANFPCPAEPLEASNTLDGFSAAILTHCELSRQECLVLVSLQDRAHPDVSVVGAYSAILPLFRGALPEQIPAKILTATLSKMTQGSSVNRLFI